MPGLGRPSSSLCARITLFRRRDLQQQVIFGKTGRLPRARLVGTPGVDLDTAELIRPHALDTQADAAFKFADTRHASIGIGVAVPDQRHPAMGASGRLVGADDLSGEKFIIFCRKLMSAP